MAETTSVFAPDATHEPSAGDDEVAHDDVEPEATEPAVAPAPALESEVPRAEAASPAEADPEPMVAESDEPESALVAGDEDSATAALFGDDAGTGTIFDFDTEADAGPPTEALPRIDVGSGDRFFDELRAAEDDEGGLGPLDDDTDAALTAFFDNDQPDDDERWRRRFGGRG